MLYLNIFLGTHLVSESKKVFSKRHLLKISVKDRLLHSHSLFKEQLVSIFQINGFIFVTILVMKLIPAPKTYGWVTYALFCLHKSFEHLRY
jgi:hypothetical protein